MDSSSSGSVQYSGGGDEEFESRGDSFSAFLNSCTTSKINAFGDMSSFQPPRLPPPIHHQNHLPSFPDPLSTYFDIFNQPTPPPTADTLLNFDTVLCRGFASATSSSQSHTCGLAASSSQYSDQQARPHATPILNPSSTRPSSSGYENSLTASAPSDPSNVVARNPKKRSRASRRAPTTVLTTDTSNFRAMVQDFTGIPAPPFPASPLLGSRLNLFNPTMWSGLEPPPPYLSRHFAHKLMPQSVMTSSTFNLFPSMYNIGTTATTTTASTTTTATPTTTTSTNTNSQVPPACNYQLLSELGHTIQSQKILNMQNPVLTLEPNVQASPKVAYFGAKTLTSSSMDLVVLGNSVRQGHLNRSDHLGNATKSLNDDEWASIEEQQGR